MIYTFQIYRILSIVLGSPPETFTFQYYTKGQGEVKPQFQSIGPITPLDFYRTHIKPDCVEMDDLVRVREGYSITIAPTQNYDLRTSFRACITYSFLILNPTELDF